MPLNPTNQSNCTLYLIHWLDCSNSVYHDRVQVLSYIKNSLLYTGSWDWTCNLQMFSPSNTFQPNVFIRYAIFPAKDENISLNSQSDKNYQASSQKFTQINITLWSYSFHTSVS